MPVTLLELEKEISDIDDRTLLLLFKKIFYADYPLLPVHEKRSLIISMAKIKYSEDYFYGSGEYLDMFEEINRFLRRTKANLIEHEDIKFLLRLNRQEIIIFSISSFLRSRSYRKNNYYRVRERINFDSQLDHNRRRRGVPSNDTFFNYNRFLRRNLTDFDLSFKGINFNHMLFKNIFSGNYPLLKTTNSSTFDCLYSKMNKKDRTTILKKIGSYTSFVCKIPNTDLTYFDQYDDIQIDWLLRYIIKKTDIFNYDFSSKMIIELKTDYKLDLSISILKIINHNPDYILSTELESFDDFLKNLLRAAYQKKFRTKVSLIGKYHMPLTKKSRQMLVELAELKGKPDYEVLDELISKSYTEEKPRLIKEKKLKSI